MYAIIETGGKQYKVAPGQIIDVERLDMAEGNTIELDRVLLIDSGGRVTVGTPTIEGAKVTAKIQPEIKSKKIIVFRFKSKDHYRRKTGHRQLYTRLAIEKIIESEAQDKPPKRVRRRKKEVMADGS